MNLYICTQESNNDYDTFDSIVVAAENEPEARRIHPRDYPYAVGYDSWPAAGSHGGWCKSILDVKVELIGTATEGTKAGVIHASFRAG